MIRASGPALHIEKSDITGHVIVIVNVAMPDSPWVGSVKEWFLFGT